MNEGSSTKSEAFDAYRRMLQNNWFLRYSGFSVTPPVVPHTGIWVGMRASDEPIIKQDAAAYLQSWFIKE